MCEPEARAMHNPMKLLTPMFVCLCNVSDHTQPANSSLLVEYDLTVDCKTRIN